jgi:hypothetical protein
MVKAAYRHQILGRREGLITQLKGPDVVLHYSGITALGFKSLVERSYSPSPSGRGQVEGSGEPVRVLAGPILPSADVKTVLPAKVLYQSSRLLEVDRIEALSEPAVGDLAAYV